jgi:hypothetical protein
VPFLPWNNIRLLLPQRRADLAHRVRQPETAAAARRNPPTQWLRRRQVRDAARVAARALAAAHGQYIDLLGQHVAEMIIAELAASLLQLDQRIHGLDQQIAATFRPSLLSASPSPQRPQLTEGRHVLTAARPGRSSCTRFSPNSATESLGKSPSPTAEMPRASVSRG